MSWNTKDGNFDLNIEPPTLLDSNRKGKETEMKKILTIGDGNTCVLSPSYPASIPIPIPIPVLTPISIFIPLY